MTTVFVITLSRSDPESVVFFSCLRSASPRLTTFLLKVKKKFNSLSSDSFTVWRAPPPVCVFIFLPTVHENISPYYFYSYHHL